MPEVHAVCERCFARIDSRKHHDECIATGHLSVTPAVIAAVEAAMIEHGPDGHTDGAEAIAAAAIAALRGDGDK